MSYTNLDIVTDAARIINWIALTDQLSAEQGVVALLALNDMMADMYEDGINLNWVPQTTLTNTAPIQATDVRCVKLLLGRELALREGLTNTLPKELTDEMEKAEEKLAKRTATYFEADMSGLPIPQGAWWGGQQSSS